MELSRIQYTGRGSPVVACPEDGQLYEDIDRVCVIFYSLSRYMRPEGAFPGITLSYPRRQSPPNNLGFPAVLVGHSNLLLPIPSASSNAGPHSVSTPTSPSADTGAPGGVSSEGAHRCLRGGGGGDLHPLATYRAPHSLGQTLACAECGPRQSPHLAVTWLHDWLLFTTHPSTGHLRLAVLCSSPHHEHLGVVEHLASMWPYPLRRLQKASSRVSS